MCFANKDSRIRISGGIFGVLPGALPQTPRFFAFRPLAQIKKKAVAMTARAIRPHRGARVASQQSPIPHDASFSIPTMVVSGKAKYLILRETLS